MKRSRLIIAASAMALVMVTPFASSAGPAAKHTTAGGAVLSNSLNNVDALVVVEGQGKLTGKGSGRVLIVPTDSNFARVNAPFACLQIGHNKKGHTILGRTKGSPFYYVAIDDHTVGADYGLIYGPTNHVFGALGCGTNLDPARHDTSFHAFPAAGTFVTLP